MDIARDLEVVFDKQGIIARRMSKDETLTAFAQWRRVFVSTPVILKGKFPRKQIMPLSWGVHAMRRGQKAIREAESLATHRYDLIFGNALILGYNCESIGLPSASDVSRVILGLNGHPDIAVFDSTLRWTLIYSIDSEACLALPSEEARYGNQALSD